ncbi:MAG: hypothetical protein QNJ91_05805 [Gammaproteobacteria bacterium]|nr:hypothetical protein [Gammaproteobacteria bacterium]
MRTSDASSPRPADDLSDAINKDLRALVRSQIRVIGHLLTIGPRPVGRQVDIGTPLTTMDPDAKGPGVLDRTRLDG